MKLRQPLTLEHVHELDRTEVACCAAIDPFWGCAEEVALLADEPGEALKVQAKRCGQSWAMDRGSDPIR